MKIVTTTSVLPYDTPAIAVLRRLARLGFEGLDMGFDCFLGVKNAPFFGEEWEKWAKELRQEADALGVSYTHAHAMGDASNHTEGMRRCFAAGKILGVRYLVVHPINLTEEGKALEDEEAFIRKNKAALPPLLAWAEEYGITVLTENLPWSAGKYPRVCARLVEEMAHPRFGWCYDTGHANIIDLRPSALAGLVPPLSLHLQDNHHGIWKDEHLMPGDGDVDFAELWQVLGDLGYQGDYVLEAHHQSLEAKEEERDSILTELLRRSRIIRDALVADGF